MKRKMRELVANVLGFFCACGVFTFCYWIAGQVDESGVHVAEAALLGLLISGGGYLIRKSSAGFRGFGAWLLFLLTAVGGFQYWFLSMSDYFAIGGRIVYDQGFTNAGFLLLSLVPIGIVGLCWMSVVVGELLFDVLSRSRGLSSGE